MRNTDVAERQLISSNHEHVTVPCVIREGEPLRMHVSGAMCTNMFFFFFPSKGSGVVTRRLGSVEKNNKKPTTNHAEDSSWTKDPIFSQS